MLLRWRHLSKAGSRKLTRLSDAVAIVVCRPCCSFIALFVLMDDTCSECFFLFFFNFGTLCLPDGTCSECLLSFELEMLDSPLFFCIEVSLRR